MLNIRCPDCEKMVDLSIADWEDYMGVISKGQEIRIGLNCPKCGREFILQATLTEVGNGW